MRPRPAWREAAGAATAGLAVAALLARLAATVAGSGSGRTVATALLLETAYLLASFACLGAAVPRNGGAGRAALWVALPAAAAMAAVAAATGTVALLGAPQLPAAATGLLGFGAGRAARDAAGSTRAPGLALLLAASSGFGLLAVSHLAGVLEPWPRAGELLLSLDPFVAVGSAAGLDLVRTRALYDALTLSGHRFVYPTPLVSSAVLALAGLALAGLRPRRLRASRGLRDSGTRSALSSSREISA